MPKYTPDSFVCPSNQCGVYRIRNVINGKVYIGSTSATFRERSLQHLNCLRMNRHPNCHLQRAWNIDGEGSFVFEILEIVADISTTLNREQTHLDGTPVAERYNIRTTTTGNMINDEIRAKISAAHKGKKLSDEHKAKLRIASQRANGTPEARARMSAQRKGRILSAEHKAKVSAGNKGKFVSAETGAKISASKKGKKASPKALEAQKNKRLSPEHRAKIGLSQLGRKRSSETCAKIAAANHRRKLSDETKQKIRDAHLKLNREKRDE